MRLTDHSENPILSPCLAWFGGGGRKGPSKQEQQQAQQQQNQMQQAAVDQAAAQQRQMEMQRQQFEEQKRQQAEALRQMELNKPAPGAQVVQGDAEGDMRRQAAQRRGMRRSILAGESDQGAGDSSTLG
jgi:colicin import membrane protein